MHHFENVIKSERISTFKYLIDRHWNIKLMRV